MEVLLSFVTSKLLTDSLNNNGDISPLYLVGTILAFFRITYFHILGTNISILFKLSLQL